MCLLHVETWRDLAWQDISGMIWRTADAVGHEQAASIQRPFLHRHMVSYVEAIRLIRCKVDAYYMPGNDSTRKLDA